MDWSKIESYAIQWSKCEESRRWKRKRNVKRFVSLSGMKKSARQTHKSTLLSITTTQWSMRSSNSRCAKLWGLTISRDLVRISSTRSSLANPVWCLALCLSKRSEVVVISSITRLKIRKESKITSKPKESNIKGKLRKPNRISQKESHRNNHSLGKIFKRTTLGSSKDKKSTTKCLDINNLSIHSIIKCHQDNISRQDRNSNRIRWKIRILNKRRLVQDLSFTIKSNNKVKVDKHPRWINRNSKLIQNRKLYKLIISPQ